MEFCTRCNFTRRATLHWTHCPCVVDSQRRDGSDLAEAALDRRDERVATPRRPAAPRPRPAARAPCVAPSFISASTLAAFAPLTCTFASYAGEHPRDDRRGPRVQTERVAHASTRRPHARRPARRGGLRRRLGRRRRANVRARGLGGRAGPSSRSAPPCAVTAAATAPSTNGASASRTRAATSSSSELEHRLGGQHRRAQVGEHDRRPAVRGRRRQRPASTVS